MSMTDTLSGTRILIVGGSSGLGQASAAAFAEAGAEVTIASRSAEKLEAAAEDIGHPVAREILDHGDAQAVADYLGRTEWDHVVVSGAETPMGSVADMTLEDAHAAMESKFWGSYRVAKFARIAEGGSLTFLSGFLSDRPNAGSVLQGAINAALEGLMRGLALEMAPVRVNAVSPGMIDTPIWSGMTGEGRKKAFENTAAGLPVGRIGQPQDIANAVVFAAATGYATGAVFRVDGGGAIA